MEPRNDDGTECQKTREQNARRVGRQAPEPCPERDGTCLGKKEGGNHDRIQCRNTRETNPTTLSGTRWNQDMLMEQNARRPGKQSPEPYPEPGWRWNRIQEPFPALPETKTSEEMVFGWNAMFKPPVNGQRKFRSSNFRLYWKLPLGFCSVDVGQQRCFTAQMRDMRGFGG